MHQPKQNGKSPFDPYPVFLQHHTARSLEYVFQTRNGTKYFIGFKHAPYYFRTSCKPCQSVYEVSFTPDNFSTSHDYRVKPTIVHTILNFLQQHRAPVLYVCDNTDNKEASRARLFSRWLDSLQTAEFQHDYRSYVFTDYTLILGMIAFKWDDQFEDYFEQLEHCN